MLLTPVKNYIEWLMQLGFPEPWAVFLKTVSLLIILAGLCFFLNWIAKLLIRLIEKQVAPRTKIILDDYLVEKKVFHHLSHLAPAFLIYFANHIVFGEYPWLSAFIEKASYVYMLLAVTLSLNALIDAMHASYNTLPISQSRPIKGYIQALKIFLFVTLLLLTISIIFRIDMKVIFAGMGALTAVLILVFKDTILGFIASIQISANDLVKPGDWIQVPSRNIDGVVLDISLTTVKVQNFDKTIMTIPTYAMVSETIQNWKGMEESEGRRIKRHLLIDMKSVKFCSPEMIEKYKKIQILKGYIEGKQKELADYNIKHHIDDSVLVNGRRMTNVGTFRAYVTEYLKNHPMIHKDMTFLVRHLQPTENGLPIEVYVFSKDKNWATYESIQADIFDHLLAVVREFDLQVFQAPSGDDIRALARGSASG